MLSVEVTLYAKERGGREYPIDDLGYACCCKVDPYDRNAYDCRINFYCKYPVNPGEVRRADIFLITGEDAETLFRKSQKIFLCEDRIIGEARLYTHKRQMNFGQVWISAPKPARQKMSVLRTSPGRAEKFLETVKQRFLTG